MKSKFELFKQIIRECNYDNTYKMAWAKSLVELSTHIELTNDKTVIKLEDIAKKYIKYYWNQTIFFDLIQGSNLTKPPKILTLVKELIEKYFSSTQSNNPILYEKAENKFEELVLIDDYMKTVNKVVTVLKKDVSYRFPKIEGKNTDIYTYNQGDDYLVIDTKLLEMFKENERDLYDLINYRWGLVLETFNSSPRINKKVKIMDEREIKRSSLKKFRKYLDLVNENHDCFICGNAIDDYNVSIDHVIPWSYMYSDDIWNLVYVCKGCNSSKNNRIPTKETIAKLKRRNDALLNKMEELNYSDKLYKELKLANEKDYVEKFWIGSKN